MYRVPSPQKKSDKGSFSDFFLREGGGGGVCIQAKTGVVAIAERFKQESMYKLSAGAKKAAVVESWPLWRDGR